MYVKIKYWIEQLLLSKMNNAKYMQKLYTDCKEKYKLLANID